MRAPMISTRLFGARPCAPVALAALTASLLVTACGPTTLPPSDSAARVGQDELPYKVFEEYLKLNVGTDPAKLSAIAMSRLFDQFIDEELIYRLANEEGFATASTPKRLATEAMLAEVLHEVPRTQVEVYYDQHRSEFERPERVRLRQILVEERHQAEAALAALEAGEDFAAVAARSSLDPSSGGGDQGELSRNDLPPAFAETVFGLAPGEISPIVPTEYGFHIFQVTQHMPAETAPIAQVETGIRNRLRQAKVDVELLNLLRRARDRYNIEIYERNLPFEYRGFYLAAKNRAL